MGDTSDENIVIPEPDYLGYFTTITSAQQANLRQLAAHLLTLPNGYPDFEMRLFVNMGCRGFGHARAFRADCGTAACAVGHGPIAGIPPLSGETWHEYSYRAFVPEPFDEGG